MLGRFFSLLYRVKLSWQHEATNAKLRGAAAGPRSTSSSRRSASGPAFSVAADSRSVGSRSGSLCIFSVGVVGKTYFSTF